MYGDIVHTKLMSQVIGLDADVGAGCQNTLFKVLWLVSPGVNFLLKKTRGSSGTGPSTGELHPHWRRVINPQRHISLWPRKTQRLVQERAELE
jgi:hypothetical protein